MTKDDIIRMAREAECSETYGSDSFRFTVEELERFAALIAADEREACALLLENYAVQYDAPVWAFKISEAIRARGDK